MNLSIYAKCEAARKKWQAIKPTKTEYGVVGAEDVMNRSLALRVLELPVKEFLSDAISRSEINTIGEEGIQSLINNQADEDRHDEALENCAAVFHNYNFDYDKEAILIRNEWLTHPDHPITKAAVLENGIFFVVLPLYRRFGSESLRTTSIDQSADEILHVRLHRHVSKELGHRPSKSLDNLRKKTVSWILEKLDVPGFTKEQFLKASDDLMYKGITTELDFTQSFQVPAFFERKNSALPYYS